MIKYESNLSNIVLELTAKFNSLNDSDKLFKQAAFDASALVSDRVQQEGLNIQGKPIRSYAWTSSSFYSKEYAKKRKRKGLQIQYVDLTFSGDMMGEFLPAPYLDSWVVGFVSDKQGKIAEFNELRFGTIFNLSKSELGIIESDIIKKIDGTFR